MVEKGLFFHKLSTSVNMRESDQTEGGGGVISIRVGGDGGKVRAPGEKKFFLKFFFFLSKGRNCSLHAACNGDMKAEGRGWSVKTASSYE